MTTSGLRARSAAALGSSPTLAAFRVAGYPALWLSGTAAGLGWSATMVAIGWITLTTTNSVLAVGRDARRSTDPGPRPRHPARWPRRPARPPDTLILVNLVATLPLLWAAAVATNGTLAVAQLIALSLALGVVDTLRGTATQTYSFDLVGAGGATNAIALGNLGVFLAGAVGSIAGGVAIERIGVAAPFILSATMAAVAAALSRRRSALAPDANDRHRTWSRASRDR